MVLRKTHLLYDQTWQKEHKNLERPREEGNFSEDVAVRLFHGVNDYCLRVVSGASIGTKRFRSSIHNTDCDLGACPARGATPPPPPSRRWHGAARDTLAGG